MNDLLSSFLIFVGLHFLLFLTVNTVVWRYFEDEIRDVSDWVMLMFIFAVSEILLILGVIGFVGQLNLAAVVIGTGVCFLLGGVRFRFLGPLFYLGSREALSKLRHLFFRSSGHGKEWLLAVFAFLILYGGIELFNAFLQYPWEYDTIAYHLPIAIEWLKSQSLWTIFYAVFGGPLGYYPAHHELLTTWFMLPFQNDYLANIPNFGIAFVSVITLIKFLKELEIDDFLSALGAALLLVMPIFLRQIGTSQVDFMVALSVLMSFYFLLRTFKRKDGVLLFPVLLSAAALLGTKYSALMYILPIIAVFFLLARYWSRSSRWWFVWFFLILGTIGSMWYWRNFALTGNPVFPAEVKFGETVIFSGYQDFSERIEKLSLWSKFSDSDKFLQWLYVMKEETGWHLYLVILAYAVLILELILKLYFSTLKKGEGKLFTLMLFFLPVYWYLYVITPYTASMMIHNVRYAMPWLMLSIILVMVVVAKLPVLKKPITIGLLGLLLWQFLNLMGATRLGLQKFLDTSLISAYPWVFLLFLITIAFGFLFFELWRKKSRLRVIPLVLFTLVGFLFFEEATVARSETRHVLWQRKYQFPLMKTYEWLDKNVPQDAVIANTLNPLYYPLYGEGLGRKVGYVNINNCSGCDYFDYQNRGTTNGLRDQPSYPAWRKNLSDFGAQYLVIGYSISEGLEKVTPVEQQWVKEHPEEFALEFNSGDASVYRVMRE